MLLRIVQRLPYWLLPLFLVVTVLWRGGKSLESTWMWVGVVAVLYGCSLLCSLLQKSRKNPVSAPLWLWVCLLAFFGWALLSFLHSSTLTQGFDEVLRTGAGILLMLWVVAQRTDRLTENALQVVTWVTLLACVLGIAVYVLQPVNRFVGTFFDYRFHTDYWPNAWGEYVLLTWPIVYYWFQKKVPNSKFQAPNSNLLRMLVVGFVLGCLFLSFSRGSIIAFVGQIVAWNGLLLFGKKTRKQPWGQLLKEALAIALVACLSFTVINSVRSYWFDVQSMSDKVVFASAEGSTSVDERSQFFADAWNLSTKKPWVGFGPYSFRDVHTIYQQEVLATADHPHNIFLKLAAERGWPAVVLLIAILVSVLLPAVRAMYRHYNTKQYSPSSLPIVIGVVGALAHLQIDYNLQFVSIAVLFWLYLGFLAPRNVAVRTHVIEGVLIGFLMFAASREVVHVGYATFAQKAQARGDLTTAEAYYDRAAESWFSRNLLFVSFDLALSQNDFTGAQESLDAFARQNSFAHRLHKHQAELAYYQGNFHEALGYYQEALTRGKYNDLQIILGFLRTLVALDDRAAIEQVQPTIETLLERYELAFVRNSHYISLSQNVEAFLELLTLLRTVYPEKEPFYIVLGGKVERLANEARADIEARQPGHLW